MRRTPLGGLFIAASLGVEIAEIFPGPLLYWSIGFGLFAIPALAWKRTAIALSATLLFFGFWGSFRKTSDQGYQLRIKPEFTSRIPIKSISKRMRIRSRFTGATKSSNG